MSARKKVCFVTPGHISTNPRLVKEATALDRLGYDVHIVFSQYIQHWSALDEQLLSSYPNIAWSCLNWEKRGLKRTWVRYVSGVFQKMSKLLFARFQGAERYAINRHYNWQLKKAVQTKADLFVGHNLAALPVVVSAARSTGAKCGFDAEDFHRHEETDDKSGLNYRLKVSSENSYFEKLDYFTTSSDLIAREYKRIYPNLDPVVILNVFPVTDLPEILPSQERKKVRLFWFSQWVGKGRGIEETLMAMASLKTEDIELHILGDSFGDDRLYFEDLVKQYELSQDAVKFYSPIPPDEIIPFASQFDIGLATETSVPLNRDICLTNKIFTYIQAGLCVIASDTSAQKALLEQYPTVGKLYKKGEYKDLCGCLYSLISNPERIVKSKENARKLGREELNWEIEQRKFTSIVERLT